MKIILFFSSLFMVIAATAQPASSGSRQTKTTSTAPTQQQTNSSQNQAQKMTTLQPKPVQAPPPAQPVQQPAPLPPVIYAAPPVPHEYVNPTTFRILATYDYVLVNPKDLNDQRSATMWDNTTRSEGNFNALGGFTVGGGYRLGPGFVGIEYNHDSQELANTLILPSNTKSIRDTFEYDAVYALYDLVYQPSLNHSFEVGGGVGYAIKYEFHNILSNSGTTEDLYWQDHPLVFKVRANYNYHINENFIVRAGADYEYATSSNMTADSSHPSIIINGGTVISGQTLRTNTGQDVKVDMSGFRLHIGGVLAF